MRRILLGLAALLFASVAHAEGGAEEEGSLAFFYEMGNLLLLLGVIVYLARKPVLEYLAGRRSEIQSNIERSEKLLQDAQERLAEWEAKAAGLDAEVERIKAETKRSAEKQGEDIIAAAEVSAERIRTGASAVVERELFQAREKLHQEAADMAVEMATRILTESVSDADRGRLVDEFIGDLERGGAR